MNLWGHKHSLHNSRHETKGRRGKFVYSRSQSVQSPLEMGKPKPEETVVRTETWTWVSLQRRNLAWKDYAPRENPPPFLFLLRSRCSSACTSPVTQVHLTVLSPTVKGFMFASFYWKPADQQTEIPSNSLLICVPPTVVKTCLFYLFD